jgi:hypothetical protein
MVSSHANKLMVLIDRKMQLTPGAPSRSTVLFLVPFVLAVDLEAGGINNHEDCPGPSLWLGYVRGKEMLRLDRLLKSGMVMSAFMIPASEFMKPSV